MPDKYGVGFTVYENEPQPENTSGYFVEKVGRYVNYHFTSERYFWPKSKEFLGEGLVIDAFSPNLNKFLHVGHLRNLALAASLQRMLPAATFVSMLGAALGIDDTAKKGLLKWFQTAAYTPHNYTDVEVTERYGKVVLAQAKPGTDRYEGCLVFEGKIGPVVLQRSDGTSTYALHDLAFKLAAHPTHYVTGCEQKEHFANLGLEKWLEMGIVLDPVTGKKLKSRDGNALLAIDALQMVADGLRDTPQRDGLAWNVLAWNFLHCGRDKNVRFNPKDWIKPEAPGMYITYTFARVVSAFGGYPDPEVSTDLSDSDVKLLGYASYLDYYLPKARENFDPSQIANFAYDLAKQMTAAYESEPIREGRPGFKWAMMYALARLGDCMTFLNMIHLQKV